MTRNSENWAKWHELHRMRDSDPLEVAAEFLRENGYLVDTPDSLRLPVQVARTGSFTGDDNWRLALHIRVLVGERKFGVGYEIDASRSGMDPRAFTGSIGNKISDAILSELMPQIEVQCAQEIERAKKEAGI